MRVCLCLFLSHRSLATKRDAGPSVESLCYGPCVMGLPVLPHHGFLGELFVFELTHCWPPTLDLSSSYFLVTHSRLGMCGAAPWPLQPWVPGPLCPFVSREVDELRPHGAHSETAQPDLAAVLLFSLFSFGLRFE